MEPAKIAGCDIKSVRTMWDADRIGAMSYEVLARKLRPAGFDALVGQDHVVRALRHALDAGRLHHAYLFTGSRGVGKTTIARILAKSLNCEQGVSAQPCGACSVCIAVKENRFVDLIEVDAASRTGVDDTRELLENAQYLPTQGRFKVYLIDEVHMLSAASFNALLKTLEEPPEHVKFLLATTDPKKVPATVLSRCLQFQLKNLSRDAIVKYLGEVLGDEALGGEGVEFEVGALEIIARCARGSMRDALSLTDQAIAFGQGSLRQADVVDMLGVAGRDEVAALVDGLANGSATQLMSVSASLAERGADFSDVLQGLLEALHELAVRSAVAGGEETENVFSAEELQLYYQIALIGGRDLNIAPDERSGFEMTLLRMLAFAPDAGSRVPTRGGTISDAPPIEAPVSAELSAAADQNQWFDWVSALNVGGVVRMIAEHSVLLDSPLPKLSICLDRQHDTLLSKSQLDQLQRALQELLEQPVLLDVQVGELPAESPAQRRNREALARQANAESAIEQDAVVNGLLSEFGGRVDEVRPV